MGLHAADIGDIVSSTLRDLGRGKWTDLTSDIQEHHAMRRLMSKKRMEVFDSVPRVAPMIPTLAQDRLHLIVRNPRAGRIPVGWVPYTTTSICLAAWRRKLKRRIAHDNHLAHSCFVVSHFAVQIP